MQYTGINAIPSSAAFSQAQSSQPILWLSNRFLLMLLWSSFSLLQWSGHCATYVHSLSWFCCIGDQCGGRNLWRILTSPVNVFLLIFWCWIAQACWLFQWWENALVWKFWLQDLWFASWQMTDTWHKYYNTIDYICSHTPSKSKESPSQSSDDFHLCLQWIVFCLGGQSSSSIRRGGW